MRSRGCGLGYPGLPRLTPAGHLGEVRDFDRAPMLDIAERFDPLDGFRGAARELTFYLSPRFRDIRRDFETR